MWFCFSLLIAVAEFCVVLSAFRYVGVLGNDGQSFLPSELLLCCHAQLGYERFKAGSYDDHLAGILHPQHGAVIFRRNLQCRMEGRGGSPA